MGGQDCNTQSVVRFAIDIFHWQILTKIYASCLDRSVFKHGSSTTPQRRYDKSG